jgi:hypothetical protein
MQSLIARICAVAALAAPVSISACSSSNNPVDADAFDTLQACFTEHHDVEAFTIDKAITICCLDHPIGPNPAGVVCGATQASCESYVGASLRGSDASGSEIATSCADYIAQRSM